MQDGIVPVPQAHDPSRWLDDPTGDSPEGKDLRKEMHQVFVPFKRVCAGGPTPWRGGSALQ